MSGELVLAGYAQAPVRGPGLDDQGAGMVVGAVASDAGDAEAFGPPAHRVDQVGVLDSLGETGEVSSAVVYNALSAVTKPSNTTGHRLARA